MSTKRVAVVGLGKMGLLHASLLNTIPEVKLVAFCEKSGLIRRFSKNIFPGIPVVEDITSLRRFDIDAAYITTPPSTHFVITNTLLSENVCRHVFVEKPLANNPEESRKLASLPTKLNIESINMVGYNRRFNVTFMRARRMIEEGTLGELVSFEGYALSSDFVSGGGENARRGGAIKDLGSHAIDLIVWFLGDINIESAISSKVSASGAIDSGHFNVVTANGLNGLVRISWVEPSYRLPEIGIVLIGNNGMTLAVDDDKLEIRDKNGQVKTWHKHDLGDHANFMLAGTDYFREDEAFINAVVSNKPIQPDFGSSQRVDELIFRMETLIRQT